MRITFSETVHNHCIKVVQISLYCPVTVAYVVEWNSNQARGVFPKQMHSWSV